MEIPTLTDLGYENVGDGFRYPVKRPQGSELAEHHKAFNKVTGASTVLPSARTSC